jgi:hypothetical protein
VSRRSKWIVAIYRILAFSCICAAHASSLTPSGAAPDQKLAGRSFLIAREAESPGYRAYSYVLLPPGNSSASEAILSAYLAIDDVNRLQNAGADAQDLNIVYLPLLDSPPANAPITWFLAHYDYDRARNILSEAAIKDQRRPYLVSYTTALSARPQIDQNELLVRDLSSDPSALTSSLDRQLSPASPLDEKVRGVHRLTGRAFLLADKPEGPGYGLYSYVLFGEPVNVGNRELYRAILSAFLSVEEIRRFEAAKQERKNLNVTYLPIRELPPASANADWLLDHYDYARAQVILSKLMDRAAGPYIVSYDSPLSAVSSVESGRLLVEELSGVTPDLAFLWVNEFTAQAGRPQYWDKPALRTLMLNLRTEVAVAARAFEEVRSANSNLSTAFAAKIKIQE